MRAADLVTALVLMAVGVLVLADALRLGIGWGTDGPRSGFFPFWLAVLLLVCCLAIGAQAWRARVTKPFVSREGLAPVLKMLLPATAAVVVTQFFGLYVATALYMGFYMRWIGRHSWLAVTVMSLAFPVITFVIFERWFLVPMPKGPLESWLGY
ncbi:MAG TPA: tripartite tricarboxylate transporter TctB family protein [Methylomirabilota bacterium]|nr:tripartite tricarboxylate transporter TctB family protein [Methylomirabilota bacterium]